MMLLLHSHRAEERVEGVGFLHAPSTDCFTLSFAAVAALWFQTVLTITIASAAAGPNVLFFLLLLLLLLLLLILLLLLLL